MPTGRVAFPRIGRPHVAFEVDVNSVWKCHQAFTERAKSLAGAGVEYYQRRFRSVDAAIRLAPVKDVQDTFRASFRAGDRTPLAIVARRRLPPGLNAGIRVGTVIAVSDGAVNRDEFLQGIHQRTRRAFVAERPVDVGILPNGGWFFFLCHRNLGAEKQNNDYQQPEHNNLPLCLENRF